MRHSADGLDAGSILARMKENLFGDFNAPDQRLSAALGIPRGTIVSWRNRNSIPLELLMKLAKRFGWPIEWLMSGSLDEQDFLFDIDTQISRPIIELAIFEVLRENVKSANPVQHNEFWKLGGEITIAYRYFIKLVRETAHRLNVNSDVVIATLKADRAMKHD